MKTVTLITGQAGAVQSNRVTIGAGETLLVQLIGDWGAETAKYADIQKLTAGGYDDYYRDGSQVRLDGTNNAIHLAGPFEFRVDKDATTGSLGVELKHDVNANIQVWTA